jgi:trans-aconitate 2-methyltransferase
MWDPTTYLRYGDERARPFGELLSRISADAPAEVVDLGCGPGTLTMHLPERWPAARVVGLDSSEEMIRSARALGSTIAFEVADVRDWHPSAAVGVVLANAVLQWVPGHDELLRRWATELTPGAVLAFQVPGNFDAPSHRAIRAVADRPRWQSALAGVLRGTESVLEPTAYVQLLSTAGASVDAWETTYLHQLPVAGPDHPVLSWVEGTALRPVRAALGDADWAAYRAELSAELTRAYPVHNGLAYFPFRRIFVVARIG